MNGEREVLSEEARHGLRLFRGKANCTACHLGPTITDERFHNTGVAWREGKLTDPGRFKVTGKQEDRGNSKHPRCARYSVPRPTCTTGVSRP